MAQWLNNLDGAPNDVALFAELLNTRERRLFSNAKVLTLLNENATRAAFVRALVKIGHAAKPEDLLLIYLAGHSDFRKIPEGPQESFFLLYDFDGKGGGEMAYRAIIDVIATTKSGASSSWISHNLLSTLTASDFDG